MSAMTECILCIIFHSRVLHFHLLSNIYSKILLCYNRKWNKIYSESSTFCSSCDCFKKINFQFNYPLERFGDSLLWINQQKLFTSWFLQFSRSYLNQICIFRKHSFSNCDLKKAEAHKKKFLFVLLLWISCI